MFVCVTVKLSFYWSKLDQILHFVLHERPPTYHQSRAAAEQWYFIFFALIKKRAFCNEQHRAAGYLLIIIQVVCNEYEERRKYGREKEDFSVH